MSSQQVTQPKSARTRTLALVAAGVLAVAGITGLAVRGAAADPTLPPLTPAELLGKVAAAQVDGLSATFEQRSDLGLPSLPADLGDAGSDLSSALSLLTGTHTIRVWLAEPDKAKVALVDGTTESSITRNGLDVWAWSSTKQEAVHSKLEAPTPKPSGTPTSPTTAIKDLLDKLSPTTDVATSGTGYVAGRAVYQLVLTPKDDGSLVSQVRVSVDAERFVPLGLRVIADDGEDAVTVAATSIDFAVPAASVFDFQPPAGVTVTEHKADASHAVQGRHEGRHQAEDLRLRLGHRRGDGRPHDGQARPAGEGAARLAPRRFRFVGQGSPAQHQPRERRDHR